MDAAVRYRMKEWGDRCLDEMVGMIKGILADDVINDPEALALTRWISANPIVQDDPMGDLLVKRLYRIFEDGVVDDDERLDLETLLRSFVGEDSAESEEPMTHATQLPCDDPPPFIEYNGREFVLTGQFMYGTRNDCERAIREQGGQTHSTLRRSCNYLIIGALSSEAWVHSTHGRKIQQAMKLKAEKLPICIVSEDHWSTTLT
jgi:NAD-dependent DNA ligase